MMNGATIPRPNHQRKTLEASTMTPSHAHAGTRRSLSAKLDLGEAPRELGRLRRARLDADLRGRPRDLAEHCVRDRLPARGVLERRDVELRGAAEVVLAPGVLAGGATERRAGALVAGEELERGV